MFNKHYIGRKVSELAVGEKSEGIGNIIFNVEAADGGAAIVRYPLTEAAGATVEATLYGITDSGYAQQIAQAVHTALAGYRHLPYQAKDALIDPAMELGDGVTVGGIYSVIAEADEICDALYSASLGAESCGEQPHEFAFRPGTERTLERKIAQSSASFRIDIDQIQSIVSGIAKPYVEGTRYSQHAIVYKDGKYYSCNVQTSSATWVAAEWTEQSSGALSSIIKQTMDSLTFSVSAGTNQSTITIKANGVDVASPVVRFSRIEADSIEAGSTITSPYIYGGIYKSQSGHSIGLRITGTPTSGSLALTPESNTYIGDPFFEVICADAGWLEAAVYLSGNSFAHSDETMSQVNLLNIASVAHGDRGSDGDTDYFRIVMDNGKYWEFRGDGIYYCDTDGEELNWVVLGN